MSIDGAAQKDLCFISYSRNDEQFALRFANDLRSAEVATWVDQLDIRTSEHWDRAVERAIVGCRCVVVLLSPRSVASENVADEISLSIDLRKIILPVMIEPCKLPLRLTRMHLIDATASYASALKQCLAEIRSIVSGNSPPPAPDPESLASVKSHLANVMGPIASILVDRAAARATSIEDLYSLLARHIPNDRDREQFVSLTPRVVGATDDEIPVATMDPATKTESISPFELERIATALTKFLGPIATIVVREESKTSGTVRQLGCRLAGMLSSDEDRERLLREIGAHC
jgi:hypothetical protein